MATFASVQLAQNMPSLSAGGNETVAAVGDFVVPVGLVANDAIDFINLPAGYVPVDAKLAADDMDSNGVPTIVMECGVMSGRPGDIVSVRTIGNEAFAASTVGQAGGVQADNKAAFAMLAPATADRSIGVRIVTGAATLTVGAKMRLTVMIRPSMNGV